MSNSIPASSRTAVTTREAGRCLRCAGHGSHWHHRRGRSVRDEHTHCPCNGVLLCPTCHAWAHAHPHAAREEGYIVARGVSVPGVQRITGYFGTILLTCEGHFIHEI